MAKALQVNKVSVQKGPIVADQKTMKSMSRVEINAEDAGRRDVARSGRHMTLMTPKR